MDFQLLFYALKQKPQICLVFAPQVYKLSFALLITCIVSATGYNENPVLFIIVQLESQTLQCLIVNFDKFDCLIKEMLFMQKLKPSLNV